MAHLVLRSLLALRPGKAVTAITVPSEVVSAKLFTFPFCKNHAEHRTCQFPKAGGKLIK